MNSITNSGQAMRCRGDLWSPVYDYCKLLFNGIIRVSSFIRNEIINIIGGLK